jgi:starch phosphorylase
MKKSTSTVCPYFNTNRMIQEYVEWCYRPADHRFVALTADRLKKAGELARWRQRLGQGWTQIKVESVEARGIDPLHVGAEMEVKAKINLGTLAPEDVEVQLFHGGVDSLGEIPKPRTVRMSHNGAHDGSVWSFHGTIACRSSGQQGYAVRVLPRHPDLPNPFEPGFVVWG